MSQSDRPVPMVSITVCTHNRVDMLSSLLTSLDQLFCQEIANGTAEIYILDDASTDDTPQLCAQYAERICYRRSPWRLGVVEARRRLFDDVHGDYVLQLDDDSLLLDSNALPRVRHTFEQYPVCGVVTANIATPDHPNGMAPTDGGPVPVSDFAGCGAAMRAQLIRGLGGYPSFLREYGAEETALSLLLLDKGYQILFDPGLRVYHAMTAAERDLGRQRGSAFANEACIVAGMYPAWLIPAVVIYKGFSSLRYNAAHGTLRPFLSAQRALPRRLHYALAHRRPVSFATIRRFHGLRRTMSRIVSRHWRDPAASSPWPRIV